MEQKEVFSRWFREHASLMTKNKKIWLFGGILGIALLVVPELFSQDTSQKSSTVFSSEQFIESIESQLADVIGSIQGAGRCKVMVTLENGVEYVYATEQKINSDRQENIGANENRVTQSDDKETAAILVDAGDKREGLLVTELQPTVRGVVVVCDGGDREEIREQIISTVMVALNISSKRVYVTKLS